MTWLKFIYWLCGLYALYYVANILWDIVRSGRQVATATTELSFAGDFQPQQVAPEQPPAPKLPDKTSSPLIASGGVNLKSLFNLAKAEAIAYTKPVTY